MMTDQAFRGSCLCGRVAFSIDGPLGSVMNCHCSICRKAHASAFRTRVAVPRTRLHWLSGADLIRHFESSPGVDRQFCGNCGTRLATALGEAYGVPLALIDNPGDIAVALHVHYGSRVSWYDPCDTAPRYDTVPDA